jgi:hypothetical protein
MGGVVRSLFGGSKSTSNSDNQAYPFLQGQLGGNIGMGNNAMGTLAGFLGIGNPEQSSAAQGSFKNFLDSTGFNFLMDSGQRAITGSNAARGLMRSGDTGKRLQQFGQDLGMTKTNEFIQNLTNLGNYGQQSAATIAGAGQRSQSKGTQQSGIFNSLFPGGLSDERLKNIHKQVGELDNGIKVYEFSYKAWPKQRYIGVIAQDVERIMPEALGRKKEGFLTVKYDRLPWRDDLPPYGALEGVE